MKRLAVILTLVCALGCASTGNHVSTDSDWPFYAGPDEPTAGAVVVEEKEVTGFDLFLSRGAKVMTIGAYGILIWTLL